MNERIKLVRLHPSIKLNQSAFGERLGITAAGVSRIESGERNPSNQIILAICRAFNVNEKWLRTGEGEMFNERETISLNDPSLDELDKAILQSYVKMSPARRAFFKAWVREMLALFNEQQKTATEAESEHIREVVDALSIPREEVIRLINDAYDKKEKKDAG